MEENGMTAQRTALSPAAASRSREVEWFVSEIEARIKDREQVIFDLHNTDTAMTPEEWAQVFAYDGEIAFLRGLLIRSRLKPAAAAGREVETCRMPTRPLCARCNRYITIDTDADDDLWTEVIGERFGPGYICADCFTRAADERLIEWGDKVRFVPITLASQAEVQEKARSRLQPAAASEAPCAEGVDNTIAESGDNKGG